MDIPPVLANLLNMPSAMPGVGQPPAGGLGSAMTGTQSFLQQMPSFQVGGMVGPGGMPIRPGQPMPGQPMPGQPMPGQGAPGITPPGGQAQQVSPQQVMAEAQRFGAQNPQQMQQIQMAIQQGLQSGELTQQELTMMTQMAMVALQNPQMYPQLRALAIQQGLATEQDLSPQYDPGLLFTLLLIGQALQGGGQQGQMGQQPMPSMAEGGPLPQKSPNADGSIPIRAHEGEYVIPAEVVRAKGTEFFDKLVQSYRGGESK
jgi:hypothetical protein